MKGRFLHTTQHKTINCKRCGVLCCLNKEDCFANYFDEQKGICGWCKEQIQAKKIFINPFKKKSLIFNETLSQAYKRYRVYFGILESLWLWIKWAYVEPFKRNNIKVR